MYSEKNCCKSPLWKTVCGYDYKTFGFVFAGIIAAILCLLQQQWSQQLVQKGLLSAPSGLHNAWLTKNLRLHH
jgi:hypothetical protein